MAIADDPRPHFAYAFRCAMRRWSWLAEKVSREDFRQQLSLALCEVDKANVELARAVDRVMYLLATQNGMTVDHDEFGRKKFTSEEIGGDAERGLPTASPRDMEILKARQAGKKLRELAHDFNLSKAAVHYAIRRAKGGR